MPAFFDCFVCCICGDIFYLFHHAVSIVDVALDIYHIVIMYIYIGTVYAIGNNCLLCCRLVRNIPVP